MPAASYFLERLGTSKRSFALEKIGGSYTDSKPKSQSES